MRVTYLLLFLSLSALAQNKPRIQVIPNPQSIEDFDHEFKGCPENSECDQVMGHMLTQWKTLISKLKESSDGPKNAQTLELYRSKYGLPVEFYTNQKSQAAFKPALYGSSCKDHNPKTGDKVSKALLFIKSLSAETAVIWRDQSQIELPVKGNLLPQPVRVFYDNGPVTYQLPINDQPLFIKGRELYVLKEEDGFYYMMKVSETGVWKVVSVDMTQLSYWEDKRSEVTCPKDSEKAPSQFGVEFCKTVWDSDAKKTIPVKLREGCVI